MDWNIHLDQCSNQDTSSLFTVETSNEKVSSPRHQENNRSLHDALCDVTPPQATRVMSQPTGVMSQPTGVMSQPTTVMSLATREISLVTRVMSQSIGVMSQPTGVMSQPTRVISLATTASLCDITDLAVVSGPPAR